MRSSGPLGGGTWTPPVGASAKGKDTGTSPETLWSHSTISSLVNMGRHFGDLARIRHVITYSLSPFEQKAFPNYFSKGIPNLWRRFTSNFFKVAPPMTIMYLTYTWGNDVFEQGKKKNPADFENDE